MRIIENIVMARRRRNERDKSQIIHLSLTARRSMRITAIQMKAVRNKRRSIVVRGKTRACSPPSSRVRISEQASEAGKPISGSSWYCLSLSESLKQSVKEFT